MSNIVKLKKPPGKSSDAQRKTDSIFRELALQDPIRPIIATILEVVPASQWCFARFERGGDQVLFSHQEAITIAKIKKQFQQQRKRAPLGPSIAAMPGRLDSFASGLGLLFADHQTDFGILILLRTEKLGPFTSGEIRMLTFALDSASEQMSMFRLLKSADGQKAELELAALRPPKPKPEEDDSALYILDQNFEIILSWADNHREKTAIAPLEAPLTRSLPPLLMDTIKKLTSSWNDHGEIKRKGVAHPVPFLVVRTQPLSGLSGFFIGVTIERSKPKYFLARAAGYYKISPRELHVFALLANGNTIAEIMKRMKISSSTVQTHINALLRKTKTRNRSEMIAKIFHWD